MEPARSDETPGSTGASRPWAFPTGSRPIRVVGPTEALRRRTAGPLSPTPPGLFPAPPDPAPPDPARLSGWQLAQEVWLESGVTWERSDAETPAVDPDSAWYPDDEPAGAGPVASEAFAPPGAGDGGGAELTFDRPGVPGSSPTRPEPITADSAAAGVRRAAPAVAGRPEWGRPWRPPQPRSGSSEDPATGFPGKAWPSGGGRAPLGAPVPLDQRPAEPVDLAPTFRPRGPDDAGDPGWPGGASLTEPDELFRAWQGSVNEAAAGRGPWSVTRRPATATRRRRALQIAAIGVPVAVIVTVGAGALMMLTGKANEMLAPRADTGSPSSAASATATGTGSAGATPSAGRVPPAFASASLPGYPGQRGAVSVAAITAATGVAVAVGAADGHPAIWRQADNGTWTLESAATLSGLTGSAGLTSVAHGPSGWIAVGSAATGPVVFASADGVHWQPLTALSAQAGTGTEFLGAAASTAGYVVVGREMIGDRTFAVLWYSADLRGWTADNNDGLDGRLQASAANAVAATASGFIAVGSHGAAQAIWSSPDGRHWQLGAMSAPPGATSATLRSVAVSGTRVVAGGYAATRTGDIPVVVTTGGGGQWQQAALWSPDGLGVITALTATPAGFTAAGLVGRGSTERAVTWTSPDGLAWSHPTQTTGAEITALAIDGSTLVGSAEQGPATIVGSAQQGAATTLVPLTTHIPATAASPSSR